MTESRHSLPVGATRRWPVAVLGATGAVGQTFIRLLAAHPWFEIAEVAASERSAGKRYADAARWIEGEMPANVAELKVSECTPASVVSPVVFSALDSSVAGAIERDFARAGRMVLSNARNFRMESDVPLVIPEVNGDHLAILATQRKSRGWDGGIVTNANCAATVIAMGVAPLHQAFGVRRLFASTMQAVSGAGYPGVASLDILGNVIPHIGGEEEKIETELLKLLGSFDGNRISDAQFRVSAHASRVHVRHGHTACVSLEFADKVSIDDALRELGGWKGYAASRALPSAPALPVQVTMAHDRPQPARDVDVGAGMTVTVGRVRQDPLFHIKLVVLGHNTIRGAAGGSVLNAELLAATGELQPVA